METTTTHPERYEVVTDGSHLARERVGGWSAHVRRIRAQDEDTPTIMADAGRAGCPTEAEIRAMLLGLRAVPPGCRVRLLSDREDLVAMLRKGQAMRGRLAPLLAQVQLECECRQVVPVWVRGHRGHPAHTLCDQAARRAAHRAARMARLAS